MSMLRDKDARETHLITRGNVDGIVSAALFLRHDPLCRVSFVTSPSAASATLSKDRHSHSIFVVDISPDECMLSHCEDRNVTIIDHHPLRHPGDTRAEMVIDEGRSAASVLASYLDVEDDFRPVIAIADSVEYMSTPIMEEMWEDHGSRRMLREAKVLDFSWRANIKDDLFRYRAAMRLSQGAWPSEVPIIWRRFLTVQNERRWPRALSLVKEKIRRVGDIGVLELNGRDSLLGFGTRALTYVATMQELSYAALVHRRDNHTSVSLRGIRSDGVDLGAFAEDFTRRHGISGGGHPSSAGARIPVTSSYKMIRELHELSVG